MFNEDESNAALTKRYNFGSRQNYAIRLRNAIYDTKRSDHSDPEYIEACAMIEHIRTKFTPE